jgi:hypothetical protein
MELYSYSLSKFVHYLCIVGVHCWFIVGKATDFGKLILYPATILKLFMVSRRNFLGL